MTMIDDDIATKWRGTPRPHTPDILSIDQSFDSDQSNSRIESKVWRPIPSGLKHRSTVISGWMCIPRSVVMATTLNNKHEQRVNSGTLSTISEVINEKKIQTAKLFHKNKHRLRRSQSVQIGRPKRHPPKRDYYETLLEENLTEIKSIAEKIGPYVQERYKIVPAAPSDEDYTAEDNLKVNQISAVEEALPYWKQSYIPPSTELSYYQRENHVDKNKPGKHRLPQSIKIKSHTRPFTADSTLKSQSDKASTAALMRPVTASTVSSSLARKTLQQGKKFKWQQNPELRKKLPGYPQRTVRNRTNVEHMSLLSGKRPVMTTSTTWYPISFHGDLKGKLVQLQSDMFGYQSIAEYTELCHSLNDGMAVIEQQMDVGDIINMKIASTDRRMGLLYAAVNASSECMNNVNQLTRILSGISLPSNRLSSVPTATPCDWEYSIEIPNLKAGDELVFTLDALGRVKCSVNGSDKLVVLQLRDCKPRNLAVCLGLGITNIQLLGCHKNSKELLHPKNAYEIVPGIRSEQNRPSPYFTYHPSDENCSFCIPVLNKGGRSKQSLKTPYACDHIKICDDCRNRVECRLCKAPLCWASCPLCDTRLQPY